MDEATVLFGVGDEVWAGLAFSLILLLATYLFVSSRRPTDTSTDGRDLPRGRTRSGPNRDCPICLEEVKYAVETNCGHIYCGACIFNVTEQSGGNDK